MSTCVVAARPFLDALLCRKEYSEALPQDACILNRQSHDYDLTQHNKYQSSLYDAYISLVISDGRKLRQGNADGN
jgi:hypothetical protein